MKFDNIVVLVAITLFSLAAFFSVGYFQTDEHYQIIEFASYLSKETGSQDLAWEFDARLRPALQPTLCYYIFLVSDFFGISSPYSKTFILRLITAFFSVFCIYRFSKSLKSQIPEHYWKSFLVLSFTLWFVPFLNVRFSSENYSALVLMLALSIITRLSKYNYHYYSLGILFGLSFLFRYQVAIAVVGILLWLIVVYKITFKDLLRVVAGGLAMIIIGVLIDYWFYQELSLTTWNYFVVNLLEGKAKEFGVSPWYTYFPQIIRYSTSPIGVLLLVTYVLFLYKNPKHILSWLSIPFIFIHCVISHKELRFLFPLINFIPFILINVFAEFRLIEKIKQKKLFVVLPIFILVIVNVFSLLSATTLPMDFGRVKLTKFLYDNPNYVSGNTQLYYLESCNIYSPYGIPTNYYKNDKVVSIQVGLDTLNQNVFNGLFVARSKHLRDPRVQRFIHDNQLNLLNKGTPDYLKPFLRIYGYHIDDVIGLYGNTNNGY